MSFVYVSLQILKVFMLMLKFNNYNLYFLTSEVPLILVLYVDDLFLTGDERLIGDCKSNLTVEFGMKDLGLMH